MAANGFPAVRDTRDAYGFQVLARAERLPLASGAR